LTDKELKTIEKNRQEEDEKAAKVAREQAKVDAKRHIQQVEVDRRAAEQERQRQAKAAVEQAKRNKEQAKRDAEAAKKAEAAAKKQSELDRNYRKSLDEAALRLKAAEAAYNAELVKSQQQQQQQ
jgi:hypothetical protein